MPVGTTGNDVFSAGSEGESFQGGAGNDTVGYSNSLTGVYASLSAGAATPLLKIMPFGDSITYGVISSATVKNEQSGGYRPLLWDKLRAEDLKIDYVGSLQSGPSSFPDRDNQGLRGETIDYLNAVDAGYLAAYRPDVVLLMIGANDTKTNTATQMIAELRDLINSIATNAPATKVFVSTVTPHHNAARNAIVDQYNAMIPGLVEELNDSLDVVFVDMTDLTVADITPPPGDSGVHPTAAGYEKIAQHWYDALTLARVFESERDTFDSIENLVGSAFNDELVGDSAANLLVGGEGNDILTGLDGDDTLDGGAGADTLVGGGGNDVITGQAGADTINGGPGNDELNSGFDQQVDILGGGDGDDVLSISYGDSADGGAGTDRLNLSLRTAPSGITLNTADIVSGQAYGLGGGTIRNIELMGTLTGSNFNDSLTIAGQGQDRITVDGGEGNDIITAANASVTLLGGAGDDRFIVDGSADTIAGGTGFDTVDYRLSARGVTITLPDYDPVIGPSGDLLSEIEAISGSNFDDRLTGNIWNNMFSGGDGEDALYGGGGMDTLDGGAGDDQIDGGSGDDTAGFASASSGVSVDLAITTAQNTGAGFDTFVNIESLTGSSFADALKGDSNRNFIAGGLGADTLTGAGGDDIFFDTSEGLNGDIIADLSKGDLVVISNRQYQSFVFTQSGNTVTWDGGSFTSAQSGTFTLTAYTVGIRDARAALTFTPGTSGPNNDFNGDGRSDVLWREADGAITNWLGQPNGGFTINDANALRWVPLNWRIANTGDFNGDGRSDVLWREAEGAITTWLGQSNGSLAINDPNALRWTPLNWQIEDTGDFNGDGRDDVLLRESDGAITTWLGQANGGFSINDANALRWVPLNWQVQGTGDFNGDGRDDLLFREEDGAITTWLGQPNGSFSINDANTLRWVPLNWRIEDTGDFNGDGRGDILWRETDGAITTWLGQANGAFTINDANALRWVPENWQISETGDFNGDGRDDILWRETDGAITTWLGQPNGGFVINDANALQWVPLSWHMQAPDLIF